MKLTFFIFSLLILSCSIKDKNEKFKTRTKVVPEKTVMQSEKVINLELTFEETQDALRILILNSKPSKNLKSSRVLQELYIRGLVNKIDDIIKFELPFNLHGFDCGAPDCYSTNITFKISATEPIEFPKKINFKLLESGCGIEKEISEDGIFELVEQSAQYVNYYSKKQQSNLVILGEKRALYYFPDTKPNTIKVELIDKIFEAYDDENTIVPYQSTAMKTKGYEDFIKKK